MTPEIEKIKCLIIGSGPAGYTAAIYAARADLNPVLYTGLDLGGQLTKSADIENFPGFPEVMDTTEFMEKMRLQAERFNTDMRFGVITSVEFSKEKGKYHKITVDSSKIIEALTVIIATGADAKYLGLPSEEKFKGSGVSACAVCDGFFYKGKDVVVVGAGDTALEEAIYLSKICNKVTMLVRSNEMRASKILQEHLYKRENITVIFETQIDEILGGNGVEGVRIINNVSKETKEIPVEGVFIAIGRKPNSDIFIGLEKDANGYIKTKPDSTQTNIPGVYAAGDIKDSVYRQAVVAAGSGCMAALEAERYITHIH